MRLNDPLTTSFIYEDIEYKIDLSFDNVLDVFDVIDDDSFRDYEKFEFGLELLIGQPINCDKAKLWECVYKNFLEVKVKKAIEYDLKGNPMPIQEDEEDGKVIDFEQDAEHIYTSFRQAYNINLYEQFGKMHWYEFRALLNGLPSDTIMQRIIQIRTYKPSKGDSAEYKENMRKLQKTYAINDVE